MKGVIPNDLIASTQRFEHRFPYAHEQKNSSILPSNYPLLDAFGQVRM